MSSRDLEVKALSNPNKIKAPPTAKIKDDRLKPETSIPNIRLPKKPPTKEPKIPKMIVPNTPPLLGLGSIALAINPATNPNIIQATKFIMYEYNNHTA